MVSSFAFLFPGQGAQYPGMGADLYEGSAAAREVFDIATEACGRDMLALLRDSGADVLKRTDISQPAMATVSLAAAAALGEAGIKPSLCAGFSLGEYPALACAGVLGIADCIRLTVRRGEAMQKAVSRIAAGAAGNAPGMCAVIGLAPEKVESLIAEWKGAGNDEALQEIYAANINSPKQTVVSGTARALDAAEKLFREAGARRTVRLAVAGPFHSPFMKEAAEEFAPFLEGVAFADPALPVFSNVTGGRIQSGAEAKALALRQICEGVRWIAEEASIAGLKPGAVIEAGPGSVLQGLWRDSLSAVPCYGAGTMEEIKNIAGGEERAEK
jgi:[acyl-carrier-protein] S-malonyltransferase